MMEYATEIFTMGLSLGMFLGSSGAIIILNQRIKRYKDLCELLRRINCNGRKLCWDSLIRYVNGIDR